MMYTCMDQSSCSKTFYWNLNMISTFLSEAGVIVGHRLQTGVTRLGSGIHTLIIILYLLKL